MNQCDGCVRGLPSKDGIHYSDDTGLAVIGCSAWLYDPRVPNNDLVICPNCVHQFRAIPVNVQAELTRLRAALADAERGKQTWMTEVRRYIEKVDEMDEQLTAAIDAARSKP